MNVFFVITDPKLRSTRLVTETSNNKELQNIFFKRKIEFKSMIQNNSLGKDMVRKLNLNI